MPMGRCSSCLENNWKFKNNEGIIEARKIQEKTRRNVKNRGSFKTGIAPRGFLEKGLGEIGK